MSQPYNRNSLTENILIESNYLHDNGVANSDTQHNLYIQAINATYQFNYFGRNIPLSLGGNLKDRSAGTVIRYNWFEGHMRFLDIVEVQEHATWVLETAYLDSLDGAVPDSAQLAFIREVEPEYRKAYVYGNIIKVKGSMDGSLLVHWGYDVFPENTRKGTLYFFNNTVSVATDRSDAYRTRVFDLSTTDETVECINNIIHATSETPGSDASFLNLTRYSGVVNLGVNWISNGWVEGSGTVYGSDNLLSVKDNETPVDLTTLKPLPNSSVIDMAAELPDELADIHNVSLMYVEQISIGGIQESKGSTSTSGLILKEHDKRKMRNISNDISHLLPKKNLNLHSR
ncbi:MAG: hypothetical protein HQK67_11835, partial [Desulfamplus sp.]|nr:hypothetical protein [Desulfamplus sp.]